MFLIFILGGGGLGPLLSASCRGCTFEMQCYIVTYEKPNVLVIFEVF